MIIVALIILGLSFGSFVGALTWRLKTKRDFVKERSVCEQCKHELAWYDLIPLLSWLSLMGKCRYCSKSIGFTPLLLELTTASLFIISYIFWPYGLVTVLDWIAFTSWLAVVVAFIALAVYDLRWMLLPDNLMIPAAALALTTNTLIFLQQDVGIWLFVRDIIAALVVGGGFFWLLHIVSRGKWIGGGDITLGATFGLLLGAKKTFLALIIGFYSATLLILPLLAVRLISRKTRIPFGPFLIFGAYLAFLFGEELFSVLNEWLYL